MKKLIITYKNGSIEELYFRNKYTLLLWAYWRMFQKNILQKSPYQYFKDNHCKS